MAGSSPTLGRMVPEVLPVAHDTENITSDGRISTADRARLRRIPSFKNAWSVVFLYVQNIALLSVALRINHVALWIATFFLMGRAHAQFASLMHEAAHRLLFAHKGINDFTGNWLLGYAQLTSTQAYRRVHMAHHKREFGPNEPDIPLYANYPVTRASLRRKLIRDATGQTGAKLLRQQMRGLRSPDDRIRHTLWKMLGVQVVIATLFAVTGHWWMYPVFWVAPYLTVWRVINRLRSIAEHGGMREDDDRRFTTHSVAQGWIARFMLVPYNIGFHMAHHVDAGVPFRHLPEYHRMLHRANYLNHQLEYPSYRHLWKALASA